MMLLLSLIQKWENAFTFLGIVLEFSIVPIVMILGSGHQIGIRPNSESERRKVPGHDCEADPFYDLTE